MKLFKLISEWFESSNKPISPVVKKPIRLHIKDVKAGENIYIEWDRIMGLIGQLKCINNDPETKKVLLQVSWNNITDENKKVEKIIFDYNDKVFKNFHLLNQTTYNTPPIDDFDISTLQKKMNEAIEKEDYEKANELQKRIDKILQKGK